jgi:hypothetical protein
MRCRHYLFCIAICVPAIANAQDTPFGGSVTNNVNSLPGVFLNTSDVLPGADANTSVAPTPGSLVGKAADPKAAKVAFSYVVNYVTKTALPSPNGEVSTRTHTHQKVVNGELELDCDLATIDLPEEGKRAGIQAVTAARHIKLLAALKGAKTESEKEEASKKLEVNYRAHYAVETEWRMKRLAELEKRLEEMRAQVKERAGSEEKYVEAAMTLAKLHSQGIIAEPPKLNGGFNGQQPYGTPTFSTAPAYGAMPTQSAGPVLPMNYPVLGR